MYIYIRNMYDYIYTLQDSIKAEYFQKVKVKLERFSKFLGTSQWFAGNEVC